MWLTARGAAVVFALAPALVSSAQGQCGPSLPELTQSVSSACRTGRCTDAISIVSHPALSDVTQLWMELGVNLGASADMAIDNGWIEALTSASGSTDINPNVSNGAAARAFGRLTDCVTAQGAVGLAALHVPLQIVVDTDSSWVVTGVYQGPPGTTPAWSNLMVDCMIFEIGPGQPTPVPCADLSYAWSAPEHVEEDLELTWPISFDRPFWIDLRVTMVSSVGYSANGEAGFLQGAASSALRVDFGPAYVTSGGGVLPGVSFVSDSGHDYANPVPEPVAGLCAASALGTLAGLSRRRRSPR